MKKFLLILGILVFLISCGKERNGNVKLPLSDEEIEKALEVLDEREEKIIRLRFGLDEDGFQRTLEEVGRYFNLTRERIRQIEAKAIQKLKNSGRSKKLQLFLEGIFESSYSK